MCVGGSGMHSLVKVSVVFHLCMVNWSGSDWKALGPGEYLASPVQHSGIILTEVRLKQPRMDWNVLGPKEDWANSYVDLSRPGLHSSSVGGYTCGLERSALEMTTLSVNHEIFSQIPNFIMTHEFILSCVIIATID